MKYFGLVLVVVAAGCETGGPETRRIIKVRGVGWSGPTTYALVSVDPNGGPDSPENQLLVQKLDEALQSRGFRQVDLSQAEQIIQLRYRAEFDGTSEADLAADPATREGELPVAGVVEPAGANAGRFSISLSACDGPTLRFTGTRVIEMWRMTAEVTNVNDAGEAIGILAGIARKYLATETVYTIKVTERIRVASPPASAKSSTSS
jgi:hypothetical protein